MSDNIENLVLEHIKRIQAEQGASRERNRKILSRLASLESGLVNIRRENADAFAERVGDRHGLDRLVERVERLERRLEIYD